MFGMGDKNKEHLQTVDIHSNKNLTNKSGLVVQNFLATLEADILDSELVQKILQMFSDIPTTTQAMAKLKALQQGEK